MELGTYQTHLSAISKLRQYSPLLHFDDIDGQFLDLYFSHLKKECENNDNTAYKNMAILKKYIRLAYKDGYIDIPDRPGIGVEINEEECLKHPYKPHTLRHYTGALTDIRPPESEFYF